MKRVIGNLLKGGMRKNVAWRRCAIMALGALCGCETVTVPPKPTGTQYPPPDTVVKGDYKLATMYDLERLVLMMLDKMNADLDFMDDYNVVKVAKKKKPHLIVALVDNKSPDAWIRDRCGPMRDSINERLSHLFRLKNDDNSLVLADRIFIEVTGGNTDANKQITDDSLDFYMRTKVRNDLEGVGVHLYKLHITLNNLHTGDVVWESTQKFYKGNVD